MKNSSEFRRQVNVEHTRTLELHVCKHCIAYENFVSLLNKSANTFL